MASCIHCPLIHRMASCIHCRLVFRHEHMLYHIVRRHPAAAAQLLVLIRRGVVR